MIRVIVFLVLVAVAALAVAWLAERPGDIAITWMGWRIETSVMVGVAAVAGLILAAILVWSILRFIWRSPKLIGQLRRARRQRRGQRAVSQGLVAVASGDMRAAKKFTAEADRFATDESLVLLLQAQTAQLSGDRALADEAFRAMTERSETRLLGLRGLYVEAQRRGDAEAGQRYAEEAARQAPALPWAGQAVFDFRSAAGDWAGAIAALDANLRSGLIDRSVYRRHRAVLLTARALDAETDDPATAKALALEAAKLAPGLVPAASLAARLALENNEARRAARLIEAAWRTHPHPDLADLYTHLRSGDSARERLARAQTLARLRPGEREGALAIARAAIDAREFATARAALAPLLDAPTQRVAILMGVLEETEHGDSGRAREWMARALNAARDPRWTADGMASDRWLPVSPISGRIDAFEWKVPLAEIGYGGADLEAGAATARPIEALPPATPRADAPENAPEPEDAPEPPAADRDAEPSGSREPARPAGGQPAPQAAAKTLTPPTPGRRGAAVIPLIHAPDDPGPDADAEARAEEEARRFPAAPPR